MLIISEQYQERDSLKCSSDTLGQQPSRNQTIEKSQLTLMGLEMVLCG